MSLRANASAACVVFGITNAHKHSCRASGESGNISRSIDIYYVRRSTENNSANDLPRGVASPSLAKSVWLLRKSQFAELFRAQRFNVTTPHPSMPSVCDH
jgi:hypothetical protein